MVAYGLPTVPLNLLLKPHLNVMPFISVRILILLAYTMQSVTHFGVVTHVIEVYANCEWERVCGVDFPVVCLF